MSKPNRVLQVVTHMNRGGLETMLMNYYRNIDRNEVQFDFLTHRPEDGDYGNEIKQLGGKIYHLPRLNPWSPAYHKALSNFFDEHPEYKVIHVHQDCMSGIILKEAKLHGIPVRIAHSHSSNQDKNIKYPIKLFYKRKIIEYATQLSSCGQQAGIWMFGGAPFQILNNAIDAQKYAYNNEVRTQIRRHFNIKNDELLVGHVGRFSKPKNHEFLIDIFQKVQEKNPAKLLLVGNGTLYGKIQDKVSRLGLNDKVIFAGLRSDIPDLLQAMDVFLFPSLYEGLPMVLVEAQAAGLPCVISDSIPNDCDLTKLIKRISLKTESDEWANLLLDFQKRIIRYNTYQDIVSAGFDISENAKKLQAFYLKCYSSC